MRLPAALLLTLCLAAPARAFFFGGGTDKKAGAVLENMRSAFETGNCVSVLKLSASFLGEKPPAGMREEAYGYMGRCYEAVGSADKAIGLYKLSLELYPDNVLFAYRLALIYNQSGFPELAIPLFLKVLFVKTDDIEANLGLARAYSRLGFLSKAKELYSRSVILQDFMDASSLEEDARCMLRKRDWAEALFIAGKGAQAAPRSAVWHLVEARTMAGQGKYAQALPFIEAAIRLQSSRQLRLERALYLLMGGLPRRAIEAADAELSADVKDPLASIIKGMALYSLGNKKEAEPYLYAAHSGGPFTAKIAASLLGAVPEKTTDSCKK